jgi:hypothetical protein
MQTPAAQWTGERQQQRELQQRELQQRELHAWGSLDGEQGAAAGCWGDPASLAAPWTSDRQQGRSCSGGDAGGEQPLLQLAPLTPAVTMSARGHTWCNQQQRFTLELAPSDPVYA